MPPVSALDSARATLAGSLLLPADDAFDGARRPWNLAVEQQPAAVAAPAGVGDLRVLLDAARDTGATLAVQPSGHGASGDLTGAVLIRMTAFDELAVDTEAGILRVGSGVRWGAVVQALEGTGWAAPAGTSPVVSVAGYTLGGGHSWFSRTAGLGSDNLRAAWLLRADGTHERVDDDSDPELMWALRGAGGIVGIVTALEIDLVRTPSLHGWGLTFDVADATAVIRAVRDLAADAPSSLNVFMNSMRMPDAPQLPEEIRGRSFLTVQALSVDGSADALVDRVRRAGAVRREIAGATSPAALAAASNEPTEPTAGRGASMALSALDDATIDALVGFRDAPEQWPIVGIDIRMLGGALDAPRRQGLASLRSAGWLLHALSPMIPGAPVELGDASLAGFRALLTPARAARTIPTFLGPGKTLEDCGSTDDLGRLRALRAVVDPDGVLHEGRLPR
ncbi:FAD-binding oxidoreductase [Microbacterium hydrocarbonoxydans]|uniref:FAD-binding oxidoreductase n=1 Tax=Microbacterium hydrocarbonoxydans TaxID=273678 RepID=UPI0007BBB7BD|nr:FAD-binding protein [Microbacterium hydrocarbonoxydans]GAT72850.1 FAD/FMN-containing dehydrogenase [Microbacterium sp. HM58-2]